MSHFIITMSMYTILLCINTVSFATESPTTMVILTGDGKTIEIIQPLSASLGTIKEIIHKNTTIPYDQIVLQYPPRTMQLNDADLLRSILPTFDIQRNRTVHAFTFRNSATAASMPLLTDTKTVPPSISLSLDDTSISLTQEAQTSLHHHILNDAGLSSPCIRSISIAIKTH